MTTVTSVTSESKEVVTNGNETFQLLSDYPASESDIILRSHDSHTFRVPKLYIVNSSKSPLFRELFSNPSDLANVEKQESLPVVKLDENAATVHSLLTFILPVAPILPTTTEKVMELLAVTQKYKMETVLIHIRGAISRQDPPFIRPETAFHDFFLAQKHGLHQEAIQAARLTLRFSMSFEDLEDKLEVMPGLGTYLRELWEYHERVRTDLKSALPEFRDSGLPDEVKGLHC